MTKRASTDPHFHAGNNAGPGATETFQGTGFAARKTAKDLGALKDAVVSDTMDGVSQITDYAEYESSRVISFVRESIQERPNLVLGIAAGIGVLIGMTMAARRQA